jgi:hypothetical protein
MKKSLLLPLGLAVLGIIVKYVVGLINADLTKPEHAVILAHILFILTSVFYAIHLNTKNPGFSGDLKEGLKSTGVYIILYAILLTGYYSYVKPNYFGVRIGQQVNLILENKGINDFEIEKTYFLLYDGGTVEEATQRLKDNPIRDSIAIETYAELFPGETLNPVNTKESLPRLIEGMEAKLSGFFSFRNYLSITIMSFLLIGLAYSVLISLLVRKFAPRFLK